MIETPRLVGKRLVGTPLVSLERGWPRGDPTECGDGVGDPRRVSAANPAQVGAVVDGSLKRGRRNTPAKFDAGKGQQEILPKRIP